MSKKKIAIVVVLIALIGIIAGVGFYYYNLPVTKSKAAVETTLTALKDCDFNAAKSHIDSKQLARDADILDMEDGLSNAQVKTIEQSLFSNMSYEIISVKRKSSTSAVVNTKITNLNMKKMLSGWYDDVVTIALEYAFSDNTSAGEKKATVKMIDALKDNVNKVKKAKDYTSTTVDITVGKNKNGQWVIVGNEKLYDAILGGYISAAKELSSTDE
jgi:hypothetical protein